jgi:hypothetical protein
MHCSGGMLKVGWIDMSKYPDVITFPFAITTTGITGNFDNVNMDQLTAGYQITTEIVYVYWTCDVLLIKTNQSLSFQSGEHNEYCLPSEQTSNFNLVDSWNCCWIGIRGGNYWICSLQTYTEHSKSG